MSLEDATADGIMENGGTATKNTIENDENQVSVAQTKLDELNDLLQQYPEQDASEADSFNPTLSDTEVINTDPEIAETVSSKSIDTPSTVTPATDQNVVNTDLHELNHALVSENSDVSDDNDDSATFVSLPNGESFDIGSIKDCKRLVKFCTQLYHSSEAMTRKLEESDQRVEAKDSKIGRINSNIKGLQENNSELNTQLQELRQQLSKSQEKLKAHDHSAKMAISRLHTESDNQIKSLKSKCAALQREKEASVMNYARREKEAMDAKRQADAAEKKCKEAAREKERIITQMKSMRMDVGKMKGSLETQEAATSRLQKEAEKWKEESNSHVIKVKWAQNKLKSETDAHNETKDKLAKALCEINRAKEETEQIRKNCQGMIKTYQESEEMRSNSLDSQLKEKEMLLSQQEAKSGELEGIHKQQVEEMKRLKQQYKDVLEENSLLKTKVDCLEKERSKIEETVHGYAEVLNRQKREALTTGEKLKELELSKARLAEQRTELESAHAGIAEIRETCDQLRTKEAEWKDKRHELLDFTQKVSAKNAELTSANETLKAKLGEMTRDFGEKELDRAGLAAEVGVLKSELETSRRGAASTASELQKRLDDKELSLNLLATRLDECKDEIRTLKRKHAASVKDLTRQLQQARRKLEPYESAAFRAGSGPATEDGSMGSRASSDTSLECVGRTNHGGNLSTHNSAVESGAYQSNGTDVPETVVSSAGEISTQTLVERIVRLQRIHAKKNEKIDFLHDHVQQLVDELQKKNRLIQQYILREESGFLMPRESIAHATANDRMPRHLAEEVNRKMQSVLEDTLLKNIALKESLDALGREIARLSADGKT